MGTQSDEQGVVGGLYRFAEAELDLKTHQLRVGGRPVHVEAKALRLLAALVSRPGETLTKDELLEAGWPGRVVTEGVLTKTIMKLRQALGDDRQSLVRTVHGYGYRLGVAVVELASDAAPFFEPCAGASVPLRANWVLREALNRRPDSAVWLAEHVKTGDRRVIKFALSMTALHTLKREITLYRLIHGALGQDAPVARILDWNLDQPPYFTEAEWVTGGELTAWIAGPAGIAERIEVMARLADAVAMTHGIGIVHKDLKPANVLLRPGMDGIPEVCLSDFGIGELSNQQAIEALGITRLGLTAADTGDSSSSGTPLYLAPEVIAGQPPTQRSDIHALGVMLYQSLVADPRRPLAPGWERDIEDELLREDIAATADVEPERRLGNAAELARRLRSLQDRRCQRAAERQAQQDAQGLTERLARSRLRQRWLLALILVCLFATALSGSLYLQAEREREFAEAVNRFVNDDLLAAADPYTSHLPDMTVRTALDRASSTVNIRFSDRPGAEASVRLTLARAYYGIGEFATAYLHALRARELLQALYSPRHELQWRTEMLLGELEFALGEIEDGNARLRALAEAVAPRRGGHSRASLEIALSHASNWNRRREPETVFALLTPVFESLESNSAGHSDLWINALSQRGSAHRLAGQLEAARADLEAALALAIEAFGTEDLATLNAKEMLGQLNRAESRYAEAELLQREVVEGRIARLGRSQPDSQRALNELAVILQDMGRHDEAEPLLREVLEERVRLYGERNPLTRDILNNLGLTLSLTNQLDEAETLYRRALDIERELLGPDHLDVLILSHNLAGLLRRKEDFEAAIAIHQDTIDRAEAQLAAERAESGLFMVGLAHTLGVAGRFIESDEVYARAQLRLEQALGSDHPRVKRVVEMRQEMRERAVNSAGAPP
ncbi:MAG: hypothetical protein EA418_14350 [Wenzhouxiangellaceae bacterium]|nr:MAG: hypothetical protein EA418_14350 [Wenzhouxiangellaceae bacterium]